MICKPEQYVDTETGAVVITMTDVIKDEIISYQGMAQVPVQTPQGQTAIPVEFEIDADDIGDAFLKFEESFKARLEEMQKEQERAQVEKASAIVGIDGQPLDGNKGPLEFPG